ncbi:hypothetical protein PRIC1_012741 [Phytophthora ramorum]
MAWGKNRRGGNAPASSSGSRPASSGGRGGRRRPPEEPTEQDIARSIQQSVLRVRVALQLGGVGDEKETLRDVVARFEDAFEARRANAVTQRHDVRVELLECGLNSWQHLVEMQRVVGAIKRPMELLASRAALRHDAKYDEWTLALSFSRHAEDALWTFASSLMLRLKSCGVLAKVLLPSHRLTLPLMSAFMEWGDSDIGEYQWEGSQAWNEVVVSVVDEQRQEIQRVILAPIHVSLSTQDSIANLRYPSLLPVVDDMLAGSTDARKPVVVILRGIPGSGKSTLGRELEAICRYREVAFTACSADFFFETPRGYVFDVKKLAAAHSACRVDFTRAVHGDVPRSHGGSMQCRPHQHMVLVDNTSTQRWEYEPYEDIAKSNGCRVHIVEMKCPDALTAFRMGQRNSHGVPPDKVVSMFMRWEEDLRAHCFRPQFEYPTLTANPLSDGIVGGLTYLGLFLDTDSREKLLAEILPVHPNKAADHVTLLYRPNKQYARDAELGASFTVYGVEVVKDNLGQCLRVELDKRLPLQARNKIPHITISTRDGVSASYSNDLLECTAATRTVIDPPIKLTARVGAALLIQNQRVISTSSPFAVDVRCCSMNDTASWKAGNLRAGSDREVLQGPDTPAGSQLFILYINESDVMNDSEDDEARLLWRTQILRNMDSQCQARRLLCVHVSQDAAPPPTALLLRNLQDQFLFSSLFRFDEVMVKSRSHSLFQEFEDVMSRHLRDTGFGAMSKLTILTTLEESMQWPLREMKSLQDAAVSVCYVGHSDKAVRYNTSLAPPSSTIPSVLDSLGINIEERTRSAVFCGMEVVENAWANALGSRVNADRYAVRRIDSTLLGLRSTLTELCLVLPSETAQSEVAALKINLLSALKDTRTVRQVADSCVSDQFYFSLDAASGCAPEFCVRMITQPEGLGSDVDTDGVAQLKFCEHLRRTSRDVCDTEPYSVLAVLLRAIVLGRTRSFLPSTCRLSSLVNLASERLVLEYFQSTESSVGADTKPTADDVTSGRIIFALYRMLSYLSKLGPQEWRAAFGGSLRALQGNEKAQAAWVEAMASALASCKSVMASYRCLGEGLQKETSLNVERHLRVLVTLIKPRSDTAITCTRAYIEVSERSDWSQLHSQVLCDKLRHSAAMVVPQDDDECDDDSAEFFFCEPSLAARRVDVAASSLDVVRNVLHKINALDAAGRDSEGAGLPAVSGDGVYVIHRAESDEEVRSDLKRSA